MPLPTLTEAKVAWIVQQVAAYIDSQRKAYRPGAAQLSQAQRVAMVRFFPRSTLDAGRTTVLTTTPVSNPPFYAELFRMGFEPGSLPDFTRMGAVTFVDTIVSHQLITDGLLFHELVHVVQYQNLGLAGFSRKYVLGFLQGGSYEDIPLEKHAYALGARFEREPTKDFSVEEEVRGWTLEGRY